jgi:PhnB protein
MANRPNDMPAIMPMIAYEDGAAALDWLAKAFGFTERLRLTAPDGTISHAEMVAGDGVIALATPTPDYQSPRRHRETCEAARRWSEVPYIIDGLMVYVDDVDAHVRTAKAAGATLLSEPEDTPYGQRHYRVEDLEGHRWMFAEHLADVDPDQWGAQVASAATLDE